jgi:glycosidase
VALLTGCSTLGFGDFSEKQVEPKTGRVEKTDESTSGRIPAKFTYQPLIGGKHEVFLAGDFNNWSQTETLMKEIDGIYETTLYLKKGEYAYKFIVDGQWLSDDNADDFVDDGFGGQNSIIYVGNKEDINVLRMVDFLHRPNNIVKEVYLVGSMNDWNQKSDRMLETEKGVYSISLLLKPDEYHYKFLEDGMHWITDEKAKSFTDDGFGGKNSVILVDDHFEKVTIAKNDGIFLNYGISTLQNLETVNPLSKTRIEFKTKAHRDDVESVYLLKSDKLIKMNKIAEDGSFDYFQTTILLKNEDENFDYCFVYRDGEHDYYLLDGGFSSTKDGSRFFHYSKENVQQFYTPDWVKDGIIYQIFTDRFYNGNQENNPDFSEWYYEGINIAPPKGKLLKKYTQYFHNVDDWYNVSGLTKSPYHAPNEEGYQPDYNSFYGGDIEGIYKKLDYLEELGVTIIYFNPLFQAKSNHKYDAVDYMKLDPHFGTDEEFKNFVDEAHRRGIRIIIDCAFNHTGETFWAFQEGMKKGPSSKYYDWYEWKKWPMPDPAKTLNFKPSDYYECWWGYGEMPNLNFDLSEINPSENSIKDINLATPNWEVVNYVLDVAEYWISDMDLDGFRLDVPNEVPFWFWKLFREKVKSIKPDAYLVGELWSNAVEWVNDDYFDAVMNYAYFKDPVMRFFNQRSCSAKTFDRDLKPGLLSYPTQSAQVMMNLIDSHDTFRYLESANGEISRLKLAVLFQMTYVGTPHIWYGDEVGMMGAHDPDCRRPFNWKYTEDSEKVSLRDYYKKLIQIRKENSCLRTGSFDTIIAEGMVYGYIRSDKDVSIAIIINNDTKTHNIKIPLDKETVIDLLTNKEFSINNGILEIEVDAMSGSILR